MQAAKNAATEPWKCCCKGNRQLKFCRKSLALVLVKLEGALTLNGPASKFSTPEGTQEIINQFSEVITETLKAMTVIGTPWGNRVNFIADVKASRNVRMKTKPSWKP